MWIPITRGLYTLMKPHWLDIISTPKKYTSRYYINFRDFHAIVSTSHIFSFCRPCVIGKFVTSYHCHEGPVLVATVLTSTHTCNHSRRCSCYNQQIHMYSRAYRHNYFMTWSTVALIRLILAFNVFKACDIFSRQTSKFAVLQADKVLPNGIQLGLS